MDKDISDMMKNFADMMGNSAIPNANSTASYSTDANNINTDSSNNTTANGSFDFSKISPEMLNQFASMLGKSTSSDNANKPSLDMATILKLKSAMEKMNQKEDPRSNLLRSLKPYLKESRKEKVDQYITLFNMGKIAEIFRETGSGKAK